MPDACYAASSGNERKAALSELALVSGGQESAKLAADLMRHNLFPPNARSDAPPLAIAVILRQGEDYLRQRRLKLPRICTPEELMAQQNNESGPHS